MYDRTSYTFGSAAGSTWVNPPNALVADGSLAVYPAGGLPNPSNVLTLSAPSRIGPLIFPPEHEITGWIVDVKFGGSGGPLPVARGIKGTYQATIGQTNEDASDASDGSNGTAYGYTGAVNETRRVTVILDLGEPKNVDAVATRTEYGTRTSALAPIIHYSNDGENWTLAPRDPDELDGISGNAILSNWTLTSTIEARFWRLSIQENANASCQPRVVEFTLANDLSPVVGNDANVERVQITLADGDPVIVQPGASGGWKSIGGAEDDLGVSLTLSDLFDGQAFTVAIQRLSEDDDEFSTTRSVDAVIVTVLHRKGTLDAMAERPFVTQVCLLGKETTPGTPVTPTIRLMQTKVRVQPANEEIDIDYQGDILAGDYATIAYGGEGSIEGVPTYDELGLVLASVIGKPQTTALGGGAYRHEFIFDPRGRADSQTYTWQFGDANFAEQSTNLIATDFGIEIKRKSTSISGRVLARKVTSETLAAGANAVQTLTITGSPTGGTYKLRFNGQVTSSIAFDANAAAIDSALEALTTIGAGNIAVSGSGPFTLTFQGDLAGKEQPLVELDTNALTGGTSPSATIVIATLGGHTTYDGYPVLPTQWDVYYASTLAGLGAGQLGKLYDASMEIADRFKDSWTVDSSKEGMDTAIESPAKWTVKLMVQADATGQTLESDEANRTVKYLRLKATGLEIASSGINHSLTFDLSGQVKAVENFDDADGVYAREFMFGVKFNETWGRAVQVTLVNGVSAY